MELISFEKNVQGLVIERNFLVLSQVRVGGVVTGWEGEAFLLEVLIEVELQFKHVLVEEILLEQLLKMIDQFFLRRQLFLF